jgi:hypothetical protein
MSKYRIYRTESSDPKEIGRRNKILYVVYTINFFLLLLTINIYFKFKDEHNSLILYYSILTVIICITAFVTYKMRKQVNKLKIIGTLKFTKTCIKKEICDLSTTYYYNDMRQIKVEKYLRGQSIYTNKYGYSICILKIINKNSSQDYFIVSNMSIDSKHKIGIIDTLNTVKSMTGLIVILNNN